ncbi:MAG: cytochrome c [Pseudomonadota bacterium]
MRTLTFLLMLPLSAAAQDAERGAEIFASYCATCHGEAARGDGPMVGVLAVLPPDLTGLARVNDGIFPVAWVAAKVDGRDRVVSHGGVMPTWGDFFEGVQSVAIPSEYGQPVLTSEPIADLIAHLEAIQEGVE